LTATPDKASYWCPLRDTPPGICGQLEWPRADQMAHAANRQEPAIGVTTGSLSPAASPETHRMQSGGVCEMYPKNCSRRHFWLSSDCCDCINDCSPAPDLVKSPITVSVLRFKLVQSWQGFNSSFLGILRRWSWSCRWSATQCVRTLIRGFLEVHGTFLLSERA